MSDQSHDRESNPATDPLDVTPRPPALRDPRLPPDQTLTEKWPVLDLGQHPTVEPASWRLQLDGAVAQPCVLTWEDFMGLEQVDDIHPRLGIEQVDQTGAEQINLLGLGGIELDWRHVMVLVRRDSAVGAGQRLRKPALVLPIDTLISSHYYRSEMRVKRKPANSRSTPLYFGLSAVIKRISLTGHL